VEDGALDLHLLELLGPVDEFAGDVDDRLAIYQGAGALEDGVKRGELAVAEGLGGELVAHDGDADVLAAQALTEGVVVVGGQGADVDEQRVLDAVEPPVVFLDDEVLDFFAHGHSLSDRGSGWRRGFTGRLARRGSWCR